MSGFRDKVRESWTSLASVFRNPGLRRLQLAFAGSIVGDWAYAIGVAVYAYGEGGPTAVGILAVVRYLSMAIIGPFTATLADKFSRKLVMVGSDLTRAVLVVAAAAVIEFDGPAMAVYVLAIVTSIAATPFRPAQASLIPTLARNPGELTAANVASSTIESVGFFAGPALGGFLLAVADIPTVYVFNAVTFLWSAAIVLGIHPIAAADEAEEPESKGEGDEEAKRGFVAESLVGFRTILGDRSLRLLIGLMMAQTVVAGASAVFLVDIALDLLDLGNAGVGYLDSIMGVGAFLGGFLALMLAQRGRLAIDFGVGVLFWAAPLLLIVASPTLAATAACMFIIGLANSVVDINVFTILQRVVRDEVMGRVFGAMESAYIGSMALGALAMPLLIETIGLRSGLAVIGIAVSVLTILGIPGLRRIDATILAPAGLDLLRSIEMLARLPEPIIERLARALVPAQATAGEVVIREGDAGDTVYFIETGSVEVTKEGRHIAHLGPGEVFGEIALLRAVPRTATITATSDSTFQTLERDVFIPAVTRQRDAHESAEAGVSRRLAML
jgi:MFS family permease